MTPLTFVIATLAAYRVAYLITREDGPADVFAWLRGHVDPNQRTWIGRGLNCILCVSFWVTGAMALVLGASWVEWLGMAGAIVAWREAIKK